jgi:DmsE family decaheme c-type cytochrome
VFSNMSFSKSFGNMSSLAGVSRGRAWALSALLASTLMLSVAGAAWLAPAQAEPAAPSLLNQEPELDPTIAALAEYARDKLAGPGGKLNFSPAQPGFGPSDPDFAAAHAGLNLGPHGAGFGTIAQGSNSRAGSAHGGSAHGGSAHGGSGHGESGLSVPRFGQLQAPQLTAFAALQLPEDSIKLANDYARLNARVARPVEERLLRAAERRRQLAQQTPLVRDRDYATLMPAIVPEENMVTTWVALDQVEDSFDAAPRFDFVQILAAKTDAAKPVLIAAQKQPKATAAGARAPMVAPAPGDPDGRYFVGSKPCETCHAGLFDEFQQTVMGRNIKSGKITAQGKMECETCHGPGSAHVNGGGGREKGGIRSFRLTDSRGVDVEEFNGVCLSCHERGDRTYWTGSAHESRGLACVNCHTVMRKTSPRNQLKTALVMDTCFQCHKDRKAQAQRSSHMPVRENKITCANCHNPHGSPGEKLLREASVNDTCYTCHADKRGPFLFEHPPVRENCLNCHEPHGSNHEALLNIARPRLCQQCHTPPHAPAALNASSLERVAGTACQNCHTNIHGSNSPSGVRWHR